MRAFALRSSGTARPGPNTFSRRLLIAAPGAADLLERLEDGLPADETELELPISIYGGG